MNRQERDSIVRTVKEQVLAELANQSLSIKAPSRFKAFLKDWGGLISPIALALGAFWYWQFGVDLSSTIDGQIDKNATIVALRQEVEPIGGQVTGLSDRIAKIEGKVDEMSKNLAMIFDKELHKDSLLSQPDFDAQWFRVAAMIEFIATTDGRIDSELANTLRAKMTALSPNLRGDSYWRAGATLVNFASGPQGHPEVSTLCGMPIHAGAVDGVNFSDCNQLLDGTHWKNVTFSRSHIRYDGGPVWLENVHFTNCTFEIRVRMAPPADGQTLTETLLASNLSRVEINPPVSPKGKQSVG